MRVSEFNQQRSQLAQIARKQTGSLAVRDLGALVAEKDVVSTENLVTVFVVVPRHVKKDWLASYENLTEYVVRSRSLPHPCSSCGGVRCCSLCFLSSPSTSTWLCLRCKNVQIPALLKHMQNGTTDGQLQLWTLGKSSAARLEGFQRCNSILQVPRSSKQVQEDNDYALFSVVLFRRVVDTFKSEARNRGFQVCIAAATVLYVQ